MGAIAPVRFTAGLPLKTASACFSVDLERPRLELEGQLGVEELLDHGLGHGHDHRVLGQDRLAPVRPRQRGAQAIGLPLAGGELRVELALALVLLAAPGEASRWPAR